MKIIDKINASKAIKKKFYSFEFFPPKTEAGLANLYARLDNMASLSPTFIDVTWGAGGSTDNNLSLELSRTAQSYFGYDVMMHLTCTEMPVEQVNATLEKIYTSGIKNILALRGDPPEGTEKWKRCSTGFSYASELTHHIRQKYGSYFGVGVAGYPEGHLESPSKDKCVGYLKKKIDSGADFVITQLFYDLEEFFEFERRCREAGITCPIIPGLLPIQTYQRFKRFTDFCQTKVPEKIYRELEEIKNDDAAVQKYGIRNCIEMCQALFEKGVPGIHFYTLNLETSVAAILKELGFSSEGMSYRALPWRASALDKRREETVRPIFWSNRPKSYLARTMNWDDFPNGRWGDSRSPSFGNLNDYYLLRRGIGLENQREKRLLSWGKPTTIEQVGQVFAKFCRGEISDLPWCEMPVHSETQRISSDLVDLNLSGIFTINSQPQVNAVSSKDPNVGWGGDNGIVYQKAYIEFFLAEKTLAQLISFIDKFPTLTYHAVNRRGQVFSYPECPGVNAVTWGVFPGKEIQQPTVVDPDSFMIWKDEAFDLWNSDWASLYEENSASHKLIESIADGYFLMNIVENDFINGDIFKLFVESGFIRNNNKKHTQCQSNPQLDIC